MGGDNTSPSKRREGNSSALGMGHEQLALVQKVDAYRARKEPIPFGMSESIWDLDSYRENFEKFEDAFKSIQRRYEDDQHRLKEIQKEKHGFSPEPVNMTGNRLKQDQSYSKRITLKTDCTQNNPTTRQIRKDSSAEAFTGVGMKPRNLKSIESHVTSQPSRKDFDRKAYVPMIHREKGDLVAKMKPMDRFRREMFLLHEHDDALSEITKGIRAD